MGHEIHSARHVQTHREMDQLGVRQHQQEGADPHQFSRPARRHGGRPGAPVERGATMPEDKRMFALAFEDPMGESMPEELEAWTAAVRTAAVRKVMDGCRWKSGRLLCHIHQKWDLQTAATLDCLGAGADGVWASLCEEGAAMGHASSSVVLMNLVRLGNQRVLETYNCKEFRKAAIEVMRLTTGKAPHPKQVVYGERAVDLVFGFIGVGDFNLGDFFGEKTINRITTLATPQMIVDRMVALTLRLRWKLLRR